MFEAKKFIKDNDIKIFSDEMLNKAKADVLYAIVEASKPENTIELDSLTTISTTNEKANDVAYVIETPKTRNMDKANLIYANFNIEETKSVTPSIGDFDNIVNSESSDKQKIILGSRMFGKSKIVEALIDHFDTVEEQCKIDYEDVDLFSAKKRKNRLSQMGKSSYGPQKLHRKK